MTAAAELIRSGTLAERIVPICMAGNLVAEHEELHRQLLEADRAGGTSLAGNQEKLALAEQIATLEERMAEHIVSFRIRALPRGRWAALVAQHPPRKADDGTLLDKDGYNVDAFVAAVLRKCTVDPVLDDETWMLLVDVRLSDGQYEQLANAMWAVNRSAVSVPFSRAASRIRQASAPG